MIDVVWLPPEKQWDQHTFELLFTNKLWLPKHAYQFTHHRLKDGQALPKAKGIILIVPHKYYIDKIGWLNEQISQYDWLLYVGTGNEEAEFPIEKITHRNKIVYYTTPHLKRTKLEAVDRVFGDGYPAQASLLANYYEEAQQKPLDIYFAGQVTQSRRELALKAMKHIAAEENYAKVEYLETKGFTQGLPPAEYYQKMASAKIVVCPGGPNTPDTFRSYEALEAMALPIIDTKTMYDEEPTEYWSKLFGGDPPLPMIRDNWESLNGYAQEILKDWPNQINRAAAWWLGRKRQYALDLITDLEQLGVEPSVERDQARDKITVLIVTSPIKRHPSTEIIDQTIADIRKVLPSSEIIIGCDGVRAEQEHYRDNYNEYKNRLIWKCLHEWSNVLPVVFEEHLHQAMMTKRLLKLVKTEQLLFVEHDTALTADYEFDWDKLTKVIDDGHAYIIRFSHEAQILDEHKHLMLAEPEDIEGVRLVKTIQWSQRPHLASTAFYRDMLDRNFNEESRTMIEDLIHGKVMVDYNEEGLQGWYKWRLWIYHPEGDNIKRSYTTDGRGDDEKFEMVF